jgi:ketosteroid isomerase-like protein
LIVSEEPAELEELLWKANREGDAAFYDERLSAGAVVVSKYGTMDKAATVAVIGANRNPYVSTDRSEQRVLQIDDDTAVVTYRVDVVAQVAGAEVQLPSYASTVWHREPSGQWQVVLHQQTAL